MSSRYTCVRRDDWLVGASVLLEGHQDSVYDLAWAPDGCLASVSLDATLRLWDADGGTRGVLELGELGRRVVFSPDGRRLAVATIRGVTVRESPTWEVAFEREFSDVHALLFWPGSDTLLVGTGQGVVLGWPLAGPPTTEYQTNAPVYSLRASPQRQWLAIGCRGRALFVSQPGSEPSPGISGNAGVQHGLAP